MTQYNLRSRLEYCVGYEFDCAAGFLKLAPLAGQFCEKFRKSGSLGALCLRIVTVLWTQQLQNTSTLHVFAA